MPVSNNDERFESSCIDGLLVNPIPVRDFRPLSREEIYNRSDESIANRDCISASWPTGQMYSLYAVAVGKRKEETRSLELPNRTQAFIQSTKLTGYLLSETHSVGRSKARFF